MARSKITSADQDLIIDSGAVLWSFVIGEQLEYDITLVWLADALSGYTYEAVVVEGANVVGQQSAPESIEPAGIEETLTVRVPIDQGTWSSVATYNPGDVVVHSSVYYELNRAAGAGYSNATTPDIDTNWDETTKNKVWVQFPNTLGSTWAQAPAVNSPTYGFFELRVTESSGTFPRTWKPTRGMVELLFSPTDIVP